MHNCALLYMHGLIFTLFHTVSCPTLSAQYADRNVTYNADTNTASYMCIIGYKPSGVTPTERVCQKDTMQWKTEEPTCERTSKNTMYTCEIVVVKL